MTQSKKSIIGVGLTIAVFYKIAEAMEFTKPAVAWIDKHIGQGTFIELELFALITYLLVEGREANRREPIQPPIVQPVSQSIEQPVSQQTSQQVNPSVTQSPVLNIYPHAPQEPKKELVPYVPPPKKKPNVIAKDGRPIRLRSLAGGLSLEELHSGGDYTGIVAEFRNEPVGDSFVTWHNVQASVTYFGTIDQERAHVGRALWMEDGGTWGPTLNLKSRVMVKLLLAVKRDNWRPEDPWMLVDAAEGESFKPLSDEVESLQIVLHDEHGYTQQFRYDINLDGGILKGSRDESDKS